MLILAVGIGIVFCIIVFICYSYKQNQRSKYTSEVYKVFKGQYERESVISMGYAPDECIYGTRNINVGSQQG